MQIYQGLDIITNKATEDEMKGVPHHLMGFLEPGQEYDVAQFIRDVKRLHHQLAGRPKKTLTIVAGGTTYYLQHLLFPGRLVTSEGEASADPTAKDGAAAIDGDPTVIKEMEALSPSERAMLELVSHKASSKQLLALQNDSPMVLWKLLHKLDPDMAARWHWKDARKVANSLRIIKETRRRHSDWIQQQDQQRRQRQLSPPPSQEAAETAEAVGKVASSEVDGLRRLLFWVWCEPETLKRRLDERVDEMVERGLLEEIVEMRNIAKKIFDDLAAAAAAAPSSSSQDGEAAVVTQNYQTGIFQTIGYKQFDAYLNRLEELDQRFQSFEEKTKAQQQPRHYGDETAQGLFEEAKAKMQQATRRYAKDQIKWVQNKLIPEVRQAQAFLRQARRGVEESCHDVQLYLLDATDKTQWNAKVRDPALSIVHAFLERQHLPDPSTVSSPEVARQLFQGRTSNAALSKHASASASVFTDVDAAQDEGRHTLDANRMYVCQICTTDQDQPHLVREVDRQVHEKGRAHRNRARALVPEEQRAAEIQRKKALGEEKRKAREAIKREMDEIKRQQQRTHRYPQDDADAVDHHGAEATV
ncbi:Leucyl aminopeptidase yscIV [Thecaphora frezii]